VFLTGQEEIEGLERLLMDRAAALPEGAAGKGGGPEELLVLPIYAALPPDQQMRVGQCLGGVVGWGKGEGTEVPHRRRSTNRHPPPTAANRQPPRSSTPRPPALARPSSPPTSQRRRSRSRGSGLS
jgi:hypothetical protein